MTGRKGMGWIWTTLKTCIGKIVGAVLSVVVYLLTVAWRLVVKICQLIAAIPAMLKAVAKWIGEVVEGIIEWSLKISEKVFGFLAYKVFWPVFDRLIPDKYKFKTLCIGFIGLLVAFALTLNYMTNEAKANDSVKADTMSAGGDK